MKDEKLQLFPELVDMDIKYWIAIPIDILKFFLYLKMLDRVKP